MAQRKVEVSPAASRLLRCDECARLGGPHAPGSPIIRASQPSANIESQLDDLDASMNDEFDALAAADVAKILNAAEWLKWQESVPERFRYASLDERVAPKNADAIRLRLELLRDRKSAGAIINGGMGGGKTWLAYAYANMAIQAGYIKRGEIRHGTEVELLGKAAVSSWTERSILLKSLFHPRLRMLIIDDVGRDTHTKPEQRRALYDEITNLAWSNGRSLVLTTNLTAGPTKNEHDNSYLAGWVGAAAYDRLRTSVGPEGITVDGSRQMRTALWGEEHAHARQTLSRLPPVSNDQAEGTDDGW